MERSMFTQTCRVDIRGEVVDDLLDTALRQAITEAEHCVRDGQDHEFDPPFEAAVSRQSDEHRTAQLVLHGTSAESLVTRWAEIYAALAAGEAVPPRSSPMSTPVGLGTAVAVLAAYSARMRDLDEVTVEVETRDVPVQLSVPKDTTWAELITQAKDVLGVPDGVPSVLTVSSGATPIAIGPARAVVQRPGDELRCHAATGGGMVVDLGDDSALADHRDRLTQLLFAATERPETAVHDVELATAADRVRVLERWNNTSAPLPDMSVPELFARHVATTPDAVAVVAGTRRFTYRELDGMANRLVQDLASCGVRPSHRVGLLMARSVYVIVAQLAIAKAGAAYVPLDPRSPASRLRGILDNVSAAVLVVDEANRDHETTEGRQVVVVDGLTATSAPEVSTTPDAVLYVMHTSGSTGEPKGVEVTHRNVAAHALDRAWHGEGHRAVLFHSSHAFDASTYEIWVPLLTGGRVVVAEEEVNAPLLRRLIGGGEVTSLFLTTGLFNALAEGDPACFTGAHEVWTGGNVTSTGAVRQVAEACPDTTVVNVYGPTETTTFVTYHRVPRPVPTGNLPIGGPMDNTRAYVLDDRRRLLPPGAVGQLYIGGAGVARSYAKRSDLTAERFPPDPFGDDRMYATGDLVRWRPDGLLDFVGRVDDQVKIHGFRIEPGEIEAVLGSHPEVSQAVVVARTFADAGGRITAYVVAKNLADPPGEQALRAYLAQQLPEYMVPAEIVARRRIPLTRNGKIDMTSLTEPESDAFTTPTQHALADLWGELLKSPPRSGDASFWDLGGHSLLGVRLVARMRERFGVEFTLRDLFRRPRLADLAAAVDDASDSLEQREEVPASAFQQRVWIAEKLETEPGLYHVPLAWRVNGRLDPDRLAAAMARVIERHEVLRTTFVHRDGDLWQVIGAPWRPEVRISRCEDEAKLAEELRDEADRPFDLAARPLLRLGLIDAPDGQVLTITVHHIVFDASSLDLLLTETAQYYAGEPAEEEPPRQYRDFVVAYERPDPVALLRRAERLRGAPSRLPTPAPATREPNGVVELDLPADVVRRMRPIQDKLGMSWFMVAAGALTALLHRWTRSPDLTFGFPTDVRSGGDFAGVIGPCLNMVVVRSRCAADTTVTDLFEQVRDGVLDAVEDQHVPYGAIVDELNPQRSADSTPYLDVAVGPQVRSTVQVEMGGCSLRPLPTAAGTGTVGKFAVIVTLSMLDDRMTGALSYRGDRLSVDTAAQLAQEYVTTLDAALADPHALVGARTVTPPVHDQSIQDSPQFDGDTRLVPRIAEIWTSVLELDRVGPDDNFFDLGGNSLKLVTLHARLSAEFDPNLPIQRLFENSTVRSIARYLTESKEDVQAEDTGLAARAAGRRDRAQRRTAGR
jgi:amino acid adenylation domain-containing protein